MLLLLLLCVMNISNVLNEIDLLIICFMLINYSYLIVCIAVEQLETRITKFEKKRETICTLKREANDARIEAKNALQSLGRVEER